MKSFEELECWKVAREIRIFVSTIANLFPKTEEYRLKDNIKRAAYSITDNIAEGYGRFHYQENIQFCRHSRGSLYEVANQLITALDEGYIDEATYKQGKELIDKNLALLNGYINYLKKAKEENENKKSLPNNN